MFSSEKNIVAVSIACCVDALQSVDCYDKALCKCSTTKFETQSYYTNALYKCNTIVLLNKALLQGMPSQLMQLLNLKHNRTTRKHCASAVQLNLKHCQVNIVMVQ
jgi:hypothetical protein